MAKFGHYKDNFDTVFFLTILDIHLKQYWTISMVILGAILKTTMIQQQQQQTNQWVIMFKLV